MIQEEKAKRGNVGWKSELQGGKTGFKVKTFNLNSEQSCCHLSGREWELRVQEYEDEDEDDEPSLRTRVRSLLLNLSLQLYHRLMKVREQLQKAARTLGDAANMVREVQPQSRM